MGYNIYFFKKNLIFKDKYVKIYQISSTCKINY